MAIATPNADLINGLYQQMLGRDADSEGLQYWQKTAQEKGWDAKTLADNMAYSAWSQGAEVKPYDVDALVSKQQVQQQVPTASPTVQVQQQVTPSFQSVFESVFKTPYRKDLLDDLENRVNRTTDRLNQQAQQQAGFYGTTGSSQSAMLQALNNQRGLEALQSGTANINNAAYNASLNAALTKYGTDANYALGLGRLNLDAYNSRFDHMLDLGKTQQGILNQQFQGGLEQQNFNNNKAFDAARKYASIVSANYNGGGPAPQLYSPWAAAFAGAQQGYAGRQDPVTGAIMQHYF